MRRIGTPATRHPTMRAFVFALASLLAAAPAAQAQMFQDTALQSLYEQPGSSTELQRTARARLAANPGDTQAVLALGLSSLNSGQPAPRQAAIEAAERCTRDQPQVAACHYVLGVVLGTQAMSEGILKAASSAGRVKDALDRALQLAPQWYPARSALQEFYLLAPGFMGGSTAKAQELARAAATPEQVRALQARAELQAGRMPEVLQALAPLLGSADPSVAEDAADWGFQASIQLINDGKAAQAEAFLQRLARERPASAAGPFGLARVRVAAGQHEQALVLYDRAALAPNAQGYPVDYRRGISLQALGRNDEARAAYTRFLESPRGPKRAKDDARKRLQELG